MPEPATLRAALQCRVSKPTPGAPKVGAPVERSVDEQERAGRQVAADHGWTVVALYPEPPGSASRFARGRRQMWDRILADLDAGAWDVIIMWEPSRANRVLEHWARFLDLCRARGVLIHTDQRIYDMRIARDWKTLADAGVDAASEAEVMSERILRALRANLAAGRPQGRVPYGYQREYDPHTRKYLRQIPHPEQADIIRTAARAYVAGQSLRSICEQMNAAGVPTARGGAAWDDTALRKVLLSPTNIGRRTHAGKVTGPGDWPPILDDALYYAVVARRQQARTDVAGRPRQEGRVKYLLSGIAECGACGGTIRVLPRPKPAYVCPHCTRVSREMGWVDAYVTECVLSALEDPRLAELLAADVGAAELREAMDQRAVLLGRLEETAEEVAGQRMTPVLAARIEALLAPQVAATEARIAELSRAKTLSAVAAGDARARWAVLPLGGRRAVIRELVRIRILPALGAVRDHTRIEVTPRLPP
jgi:site-specific DNA recombinase